jgi:hypothetical protein
MGGGRLQIDSNRRPIQAFPQLDDILPVRQRLALQFLVAPTEVLAVENGNVYPGSVNRNIFYIIGVIVVIVVVLKYLGVF